jgi:hypothetical protein
MWGGDACVALGGGGRHLHDQDEGDAHHKASPPRTPLPPPLRGRSGSQTQPQKTSPCKGACGLDAHLVLKLEHLQQTGSLRSEFAHRGEKRLRSSTWDKAPAHHKTWHPQQRLFGWNLRL